MSANIKEIAVTLVLSLLLVVAITYIFLQSWRATIVPAIAIPVSLLGTFFCMMCLGYSINVLTMFGLILVIGSLVDNAIVVVENTIRIIEDEKLPPLEAAVKSMKQITAPVIAATLVSAAIYAPIAFYGGIVGTIYMQFAVTMCISLIISAFNALTLSPALCALVLKKSDGDRKKKFILFRWFDSCLNFTKGGYISFGRFMLRRFYLTILLTAGVLAANYFIAKNLKGGFLPDEDKGVLMCELELPPGASLARTEEAMLQFSKIAENVEGVESVLAVTGFSIMSGASENLGFCIIDLDDWSKRTTPELQIGVLQQKLDLCSLLGVIRAVADARGVKAGVNAFLLCSMEQLGQQIQLQQGLTARDGNADLLIKAGIFSVLCKHLVHCHGHSCGGIPRIGIVTVKASHGAALQKEDVADAGTIHRAEAFDRVYPSNRHIRSDRGRCGR
jgi:multidrug efflux pump subunit AcrB